MNKKKLKKYLEEDANSGPRGTRYTPSAGIANLYRHGCVYTSSLSVRTPPSLLWGSPPSQLPLWGLFIGKRPSLDRNLYLLPVLRFTKVRRLPPSDRHVDPAKSSLIQDTEVMQIGNDSQLDMETSRNDKTNLQPSFVQKTGLSHISQPTYNTPQPASALLTGNRRINDQNLRKIYRLAEKELGVTNVPASNAIIPNLSLKRSRPNDRHDATPNLPSVADDEWRQPVKIVKNAAASTAFIATPTQTANLFSSLQNISQDTSFIHDTAKPSKTSAKSQTTHKSRLFLNSKTAKSDTSPAATTAHVTEERQHTAKKRMHHPPIFINNTSNKNVITFFRDKFEKRDFTVRQTDADRVTLMFTDIEKYDQTTEMLKTAKKEFFTFTPEHRKPKNVVLKNLDFTNSVDDVKTEIESLYTPNVKITKIIKMSFKNSQDSAGYFLVQLTPESDIQALTREKLLLHELVKWEPLRRPHVFQCTNCQDVGHSSANCGRTFQCSRCKETHAKGKCSIPAGNTDRKILYCVNCDEMGHAASFKGCPLLKCAVRNKNLGKEQTRQTRATKIDNIQARVNRAPPGKTHRHNSAPLINPWHNNNLLNPPPGNNIPTHNGADFNALLTTLEKRIFIAVKNQLDPLMEMLKVHNSKISIAFQALDLYDGSNEP